MELYAYMYSSCCSKDGYTLILHNCMRAKHHNDYVAIAS